MQHRSPETRRPVRAAARCLLAVLLASAWASTSVAFDPLNGDYSREQPLDVRIVTYNHHGEFIENPSRDAAFNRILTALDPDIICFQEFSSAVSESTIANRLSSVLGGTWYIHFGLYGGMRTVIASRYPLSLTRIDTIPASSTRGVTIALADLPDADYPVDVYLLGVHLKCCGDPGGSEDASRQDSADAIANWLGDARGVSRPSGNNVVLPADTPMVSLGDFNLVGGPQPENTLITGDIQDEGTYGPDVKGDWDVSDITNLGPVDPFTGDDFTWQGSASYDPSPLDRIFYTDSVVTVANSFILNTDTMTPAALAAAGLQAGDTLPDNSSDHLPVTMDLRFVTGPECTDDPDCDDGNPCTDDTCVDQQCVFTPNDANSCDDGLWCNGAEACAGGVCQPGSDPCPSQGCDEANDVCVDCQIDSDCDDGNDCTVDTCVDAVCYNECAISVASFPYTEGFESGWGDWVNAAGDDMDWTRNSGSTPSNNTGPSGAHGGSWYVYTEASSPNNPDKTALLEGPCFDLIGAADPQLTFWYHMYGSGMGTLNVEVSEDCIGWTNVWTLSGDQGSAWYEASVDLSSYAGTTIVVRFRGVTGSSYASDMSVDDVTVTVSQCSVPADCDDGLWCNGPEDCVSGSCVAGTPPDCSDGVGCTDDSCNEGTDSCDHVANDGLCDNGLYCDGIETCDPLLDCQAGTAIDCDDAVGCTDDSCNEGTDSCDNVPNDILCDNGLYCDGAETCDPLLDCLVGSAPCTADEVCDETGDVCEPDCNHNSVADSLDIAGGTSIDCQPNGIPDECEPDFDGDNVPDDCDACPADPDKAELGQCGCGAPDTDSDGDGTADCNDLCPDEPALIEPSEPGFELSCGDGVDNDCDGLTDAADADCTGPGCPYTCGDMDGSGGLVDLNDYATLANCYGLSSPAGDCDATSLACSDMDGNGTVDLSDFSTFAVVYGLTSPNSPPSCP
jgi:endonuclease/exonuclease/phosphatase family metal-dependent hydrolase